MSIHNTIEGVEAAIGSLGNGTNQLAQAHTAVNEGTDKIIQARDGVQDTVKQILGEVGSHLQRVQELSTYLEGLIKKNLQGEQVVQGELRKVNMYAGNAQSYVAETNFNLQVLGETRAEDIMRHANFGIEKLVGQLGRIQENQAREQLTVAREKAGPFLQHLAASTEAFTELRDAAVPAFESLRSSDIQIGALTRSTHSARASAQGALNVLENSVLPDLRK
jgi:hypothetical protein